MFSDGQARFPVLRPRRASMTKTLASLDDLRFLYVTGKGGVGKTTVCAALARAMAARGKRVLVAMCNGKELLSGLLGGPPTGCA